MDLCYLDILTVFKLQVVSVLFTAVINFKNYVSVCLSELIQYKFAHSSNYAVTRRRNSRVKTKPCIFLYVSDRLT